MVLGVVSVLDEVRSKGKNFFAGINEGFDRYIESAGCSHRHDNVLRREVCLVEHVQMLRHCLAHILITGVALVVAVDQKRIFLGEDAPDRVIHFRRSRHARVAQTEVEDILCSELCRHACSLFEHGPDRRVALDVRHH